MEAAATRRSAERRLLREFCAGRFAAAHDARIGRQRSDQRVFVGGRSFCADRAIG
jgi:hypothetical protein